MRAAQLDGGIEGRPWCSEALRVAASRRAAKMAERSEAIDAERFQLVMGAAEHARGPREPRDGDRTDAPNLLVAWIRDRRSDGTVRMKAGDGLIMLRRLFGLSICGPATDIQPPRSCLRCSAAAINIEEAETSGGGPRGRVDEYGEHALTCAVHGGETQRRHNEVAAAVRECASAAGWRIRITWGSIRSAPMHRRARFAWCRQAWKKDRRSICCKGRLNC